MTKIIVIGNEKGGCGKTTVAMHLIVSLLKLGFTVSSFDLDSRQQSLTRYLDNRNSHNKDNSLLSPSHYAIGRMGVTGESDPDKEKDMLVANISRHLDKDFIVIDTPGSDTKVSRYAHTIADIVVTPINDSFIDLDLIGNIHAETFDSMKPGVYSALLWECKLKRAEQRLPDQQWYVVRNRLSILDAKNKRNMETALLKLSKRFGFKIAPGFSDRVIFKELFLHGITLHDVMENSEMKLSPSILAARKELRDFMIALVIKEVHDKIQSKRAA